MLTSAATPSLATIKSRQQVACGSGDYAVIGTTRQIVGERLCEAVDLRSNQRVLDVTAAKRQRGDGTVVVPSEYLEVIVTDATD